MFDNVIRRYLIAVSLSILPISCLNHDMQILRETAPSDRPEIEISENKTGTIRSIDIDLSVRYISENEWKIIRSNSVFALNKAGIKKKPPVELFMLIIKNTSTQPVYDLSFEIKTSQNIYKQYSIAELKSILSLNNDLFKKIIPFFAFRRIHVNETDIEKIDFDRNSTEYSFGTILPHDTVSIFAAFPFIEAESRKYMVSAKYTVVRIKKNVDLEFTRIEYRQDDPRAAPVLNGDRKWR